MKLGSPLEANRNELRNALLHLLASAPSSPLDGQLYQNTGTHEPEFFNGTDWKQFRDGITLAGQTLAQIRARSSHTGTQLASTISDFDTQVRTSRLDQMAVPTGSVSLNSQKITNLLDGTGDADAINLAQARALLDGLDNKTSVRAAPTGNVNTASPGAAHDGVTMANGERMLLAYQSTGSQNGLYIYNGAASALTRATDADISAEVTTGLYVFVSEGTVNGNKGFQLFTDDPITLGTTSLDFQIVSAAGQLTAGAGLTKTGDTIDVVGNAGRIVVNANDIDLAPGIVTPGTYTSITVDTYGRATGGTNPAASGKYAADIGDGSTTAIVVTHNLGTRDVIVQVRKVATPWDYWEIDTEATSINTVTLRFTVAPTTGEFRVVVLG